jgi:molybdopterin biosynthesis enzyme MoaB
MIKTGIICVPIFDEQASMAVRRLLQRDAPGSMVLLEQNATMQRYVVEDILRRWSDVEELDLVITIGGTLPASGPSGKEIVPEATLAVAERQLPALSHAMRTQAATTLPLALLDRGVTAIRGRTVLLNLPAGAAAALFFQSVVEIIPAVVAHLQEATGAPQIADRYENLDLPEPPEPDFPATNQAGGKKPLDPDEFAAYLKRKSDRKDQGA